MHAGDTNREPANHQKPVPMTLPPWHVVAASARGTSHEKTGQPCQDAHRWAILSEDVLAVAVADGAGSAALGEVGAAIAAQTAIDTLRRQAARPAWPASAADWHILLTETLKAARAAVAAEAQARAVSTRDLATTLILLVATSTLVAAAQIGDGATVVGDGGSDLIALTTPQSGEYLNETTFLTSPDALDTAQINLWHGVPASIAAFSDGLQMLALKMPEGTPHAPFFTPLFQLVARMTDAAAAQEQLTAFLHSPRLRARVDDDVTLLIAAHSPHASGRM